MLLSGTRKRDPLIRQHGGKMPCQQIGGRAGNYPLSAYKVISEIKIFLYFFLMVHLES